MKSTILPILLLLLFTLPAFTQWQLAPVVGLNISKARTTTDVLEGVTHHYTNGLMIGLNAKYLFGKRINAQVETAYSQKGFEALPDDHPSRIKFQLNYFDLVLLGEYAFNDIVALNLGGNFGLKVGDNLTNKDGANYNPPRGKDIGITGGLKFYIGQLFIRTSYQHGLNALEKYYETNENGVFLRYGKLANQTFQVAVGYYLL